MSTRGAGPGTSKVSVRSFISSCAPIFAVVSACMVAAAGSAESGTRLIDEKVASTPANQISQDEAMPEEPSQSAVLELGEQVFRAHCASCHGDDLKGIASRHTPDLTDELWLFSGDDLESGGLRITVSDVVKTISYGIRSGEPQSRAGNADMPAMKDTLTPAELADVAAFVLQLSGQAADAKSAARGSEIYSDKGGCWDCHSREGIGNGAIGATDLTAEKWLYGGDTASIQRSIAEGRHGVCPAFKGRLSARQIESAATYVISRAKLN